MIKMIVNMQLLLILEMSEIMGIELDHGQMSMNQ